MQEVMLWRARFPWKEGIGLPQGPEWAQGFVGGSRTAVVYGLPGNVVCLTTLASWSTVHNKQSCTSDCHEALR